MYGKNGKNTEKDKGKMIDEEEVKLVANAIGFSLFSASRPTESVDGIDSVYLEDSEADQVNEAARRALEQLEEYRSTK